jgi:predicted RNase H-like HicB family nuclease
MDKTIQVLVRQQDDGRYLAQSKVPALVVVAETAEEALEQLQEELTFALESSYGGQFAGNFRAKEMMVTLEVSYESEVAQHEGDKA